MPIRDCLIIRIYVGMKAEHQPEAAAQFTGAVGKYWFAQFVNSVVIVGPAAVSPQLTFLQAVHHVIALDLHSSIPNGAPTKYL